jgi:alcohol dehydrogenase class IV
MSRPEIKDLVWLKTIPNSAAVVRASCSVRERASAELPFGLISSFTDVPASAGTLIVIGGGSLMDQAKYFRARQRPELRLVLIPSIYGSGAECSPIVVLNRDGAKQIEAGDEFLPDTVVYWPELLSTVSAERARRACGDVWAHTLEAFLSPLASDRLRSELADLIKDMLFLPLDRDARWFSAGARACALQAQASLGLVHGIAHVLEPVCHVRHSGQEWGHARLCSSFLLPVMNLNRLASSKWAELAKRYAVDEAALWSVLQRIFEPESFAAVLPDLKDNWMKILREPCTRTNGTLIRSGHLAALERQAAA